MRMSDITFEEIVGYVDYDDVSLPKSKYGPGWKESESTGELYFESNDLTADRIVGRTITSNDFYSTITVPTYTYSNTTTSGGYTRSTGCDNRTRTVPEVHLAWTDEDSKFYSDNKESKGETEMKGTTRKGYTRSIELVPNQYGYMSIKRCDEDSRFYSDNKESKGETEMKGRTKRNGIVTTGINIYKKYENKPLMPDIREIKAGNFEPDAKDSPYVIVYFKDGTETKAVMSKNDVGTIEMGVSICLFKKLLGENGHAIYNRLIDHAMDIYNGTDLMSRRLAEHVAKGREEREKAEKRRAKRAKRERERQIDIQKEAYLRAMREFAKENSDELKED